MSMPGGRSSIGTPSPSVSPRNDVAAFARTWGVDQPAFWRTWLPLNYQRDPVGAVPFVTVRVPVRDAVQQLRPAARVGRPRPQGVAARLEKHPRLPACPGIGAGGPRQ